MKIQSKKIVAAALAMSMCVPTAAFAAEGTIETSFDIYSPTLTVQVPIKADVRVNPIAATGDTLKQYTVASNDLDFINATIDDGAGIPVNVTVKATIASSKDDVKTEYNFFTADPDSAKKKIYLTLAQASTAAVVGETDLADANDATKVDFSKAAVTTAAEYTDASITNKVPITKYGSLLSVNIAAPADGNTAHDFAALDKVTPGVGSCAITGVANANADWKADDITVTITYNMKASQGMNIETPKIAAAPTFTSGTSATDLKIVVPDVGDATVFAVGCHNDDEGAYGDYNWEAAAYTVEYKDNSGKTDAEITFKKDDAGLAFLAGDDYKTKAQDFIVGLSDGRMVVSTLTVN